MNDWYIYTGGNPSEEKIKKLPTAPRWRQFKPKFIQDNSQDEKSDLSWDEIRGMRFESGDEEKRMINAALYLRRPLLITGNPGIGKSSLAYSVAYELKLGKVLHWPITTKSTIQEGLYQYDAIGRLQDIQIERLKNPNEKIDPPDIGQYIRLGPLGSALLESKHKLPRVILIDEIDKSDIDLPNDLLNIFEEGSFEIPELSRVKQKQERFLVFSHDRQKRVPVYNGRVLCEEFPLILMTSNAERELPSPFLRRCLRLEIEEPDLEKLSKIVESHFGEGEQIQNAKLIKTFFDLRKKGSLATDQLLNAIYMTTKDVDLKGDVNILRDTLFKYLSTEGAI